MASSIPFYQQERSLRNFCFSDQSRSQSPRNPYPALPVPLYKGNAGSGNEIGLRNKSFAMTVLERDCSQTIPRCAERMRSTKRRHGGTSSRPFSSCLYKCKLKQTVLLTFDETASRHTKNMFLCPVKAIDHTRTRNASLELSTKDYFIWR